MFQVCVQGKEALEEPAANRRAGEITGWQSREGKACWRLPRLHYLFNTGNLIPHWNVHCSSAVNINSHNSYLCRKQWCYHPMLHLLSGWILASGSLSKFIPTICPSKELHRLNTSSSRRHYMTRTGVYSSPISYQEPLHWSQIYWCQLKLYVFLSEFSGQRMTTHWKSISVLLTSQRRIWHCHHPLETGSSLSPNLCLQS